MSQLIPERPTVGALNAKTERMELRIERLSDRLESMRKIAVLQQKQIGKLQGMVRALLTMGAADAIPAELLINQLEAISPDSGLQQLAELEGMGGWND